MRLQTSDRVLSLALLAICLGYFLVILDSTIVNAALETLRTQLGAGPRALQWVVDGYLCTFAAGLLTGGALGDRYGSRRVFGAGLGLFVAASAACGLAPSVGVLVAGRAVQGVGAALAVPTSLALLRAAYPEEGARARAVGVWGAVAGVAAAAGPILGGLLVAVDWRWVFFLNVPVGLAGLVLGGPRLPAASGQPDRKLDPVGQLSGTAALGALSYLLIEGPGHGPSTSMWLVAVGFVVASAGFVLAQRYGRTPMCEWSLVRSGTFSGGAAVGLLINLGFYGELFVLNLYFQQGRHYPPALAGLALLPQMGVVALGSGLSGRHTARLGARATMVIGLLVGAAGLFGLVAGIGRAYPVLLVPLAAAGFGMSFTMPAVTSAVLGSAPPQRAGMAAGIINTARQVGGLVGVAVLGGLAGGVLGGGTGGGAGGGGAGRGVGGGTVDGEALGGALFDGPSGGLGLALLVAGTAFLLATAVTLVTVSRMTNRPAPRTEAGGDGPETGTAPGENGAPAGHRGGTA